MLGRETTVDEYGISGGVLCDEMGLGKTIQTLALIHANPQPPTLIVVPVSVITQWRDECVARIGIEPLIVNVINLRRTSQRSVINAIVPNPNFIDIDTIMRHQIVIAPHSCFNNASVNFEDHALLDTKFGRVIIDEAQILKNTKSITNVYMRQIDAKFRWCLTGTPIVSTTKDIHAIMSFLTCGDMETAAQIVQDALDDEDVSIEGPRMMGIVMRRTNAGVANDSSRLAPVPAILSLKMLNFTPRERSTYAAVYRKGRPDTRDLAFARRQILVLILRLRQQSAFASAKIGALVDAFAFHRPGTRSLIFCNWLKEVDLVTTALESRVSNVRVMQYHGGMTQPERIQVVEAFQNRESRESMAMVVQIQAGGSALNLQAASEVYIMSPNWSASAEMQAIARAHRTATAHQVTVTRFVMSSSIEEFIHNRQADKLATAADVLKDPRLLNALLATDDSDSTNWGRDISLFGSDAYDELL